MRLQSHFREAFSNLLSAKLRSVLAVLGVLVGTASVVALISGGQLATEHALQQFKKLGTDVFSVSITGGGQGVDMSLSAQQRIDQILALKKQFPEVRRIAPYAFGSGSMSFKGSAFNGSLLGITADYQDTLKLTTHSGRLISELDSTEAYCVIGHEIAQAIKHAGGFEVIGQQILIDKHYYTVIGVLKPTTSSIFVFTNLNRSVLIPLLPALQVTKNANIGNIMVNVYNAQSIATIKEPFKQAVKALYPKRNIFIGSPQEIINSMKNQRKTFNLLLSFIGGIALVVGGIGVMNIMLVSVVERRKEIGIRLAVGAKRQDIQAMFLTEAVVLTVFGGFLGVLLGEAIAFITATVSGWEFYFYLMPPVIGFCVSALTGIFFGLYPARKASALDPIESLRSE